MNKTTNFDLPQWVKEDPIKMQDFNAAFQTIDETLKAAADATAEKADAATVQQTVTALQTALGSGGKTCRISSGSYAGNGKTGQSNPVPLRSTLRRCWSLLYARAAPGRIPFSCVPMATALWATRWARSHGAKKR